MHKFTRSDLRHITETREALLNPTEECCGSNPWECDCYSSETVVLSFGYYEVYRDIEEGEEGQLSETDYDTY